MECFEGRVEGGRASPALRGRAKEGSWPRRPRAALRRSSEEQVGGGQ